MDFVVLLLVEGVGVDGVEAGREDDTNGSSFFFDEFDITKPGLPIDPMN